MIRAIDEIGQTVDYVTATHFLASPDGVIRLYDIDKQPVAVVPGHWIVKEMPSLEVDPGVEARE